MPEPHALGLGLGRTYLSHDLVNAQHSWQVIILIGSTQLTIKYVALEMVQFA